MKKIVFLGMLTRYPVAGAVFGTLQYLIGLRRLGYDVFYVEAHRMNPRLMTPQGRQSGESRLEDAVGFVAKLLAAYDFGNRWAYDTVEGPCLGMSRESLHRLYQSADLLINYHGGTEPRPEHQATGRLVYLETDPATAELLIASGDEGKRALIEAHQAHFTWGLNYGAADCEVPVPPALSFQLSPPVIVGDLWQSEEEAGECFTTVGNWRQKENEVSYRGEVYRWSKHLEFEKILTLPSRTSQPFELALNSYREDDRHRLEENGWRVRDAVELSYDLDSYRSYIQRSKGEFTVAKDQNVRLRSGWFGERSAQYLAAGRPVITQDTGFGSFLPTGDGLFAFSSMDQIVAAVDAINSDYEGHRAAARELARNYFDYRVVLPRLLEAVGL